MSTSQNANLSTEDSQFTTDELDAIGEVMNISMGSAATSLSSMLDRQVVITTPRMNIKPIHDEDYADLEPALVVKIEFIEGVLGTNIMVFRRRDMQIILNLLMGNEDLPDEDDSYEFDELSMSAACEVSNQMMGAAATALSEVFNRSVNISTPDAFVSKTGESINEMVFGSSTVEDMVGISFDLTINGVMNSNFMSVLPASFAKEIINILMDPQKEDEPPVEPKNAKPASTTAPTPQAAPQMQQPVPQAAPQMQQPVPQAAPQMQQPVPQAAPQMQQPVPQAAPQMQQMPQMGMPMMPQMMPQNGYYYPPQMMPQQNPSFSGPMGSMMQEPAVNVKKAKFPDFSQQENSITSLNSINMGMLMNVPLDVSVEIGKTRRPIKEIADFGQGTVIELEKQAGAPVDIIVNGQLLAHGDVVVIGDNFGVRITEIVGTKELMDSLSNM